MTKSDRKELAKKLEASLLPLTGILGLYENPQIGTDITKLELRFPYPKDETIVQFEIRCKELREYVVVIDTNSKTIKNELVIGHDYYKGACLDCLTSQVGYAKERGYNLVWLDAWFQKEPYLYEVAGKNIEEIPWTGYKVWGKYGFIMDEDERINLFVKAMKEQGHGEDYIHEIYMETEQSNMGKKTWSNLCLPWEGLFDLTESSLSHQILDGLNGKYSKK
ncbi:hypothetical protein [Pedobacter sp. Hv1]|uniref:hypothetical protein n=1 Tax=Pedobacter sp. Hv1 TaxID=1740090 RepID=UPI0006D896A8|nr:hypothetical protein [Pedobacter sp. Hv1]KQB99206.1 hypothetical protein AQF98_16640 [Pedobacter sp. Hv1]